jgi:hypothetical protein
MLPNPGIAGGGKQAKQVAFAPAVEVTPELSYGYEPAVYTDRFGNIYTTAHKENWQLALGPDLNSATATRSMSYAWWSTDGGKTWSNIPGLPANLETHSFGDEGDMALDDAGHLYFVDTTVGDNTLTRWTVSGKGKIAYDFHHPVLGTAEPVDDRPWITAHGDGHVFYFGNEGDKSSYSLGQQGQGSGGGRYTVFASTDGGQNFDPLGYTLDDSGWCRPQADHAKGSKYVYAACTNDNGKLYSYVSSDDCKSFKRYDMGTYLSADPTSSWPTIVSSSDGKDLWVLYVDAVKVTGGNADSNSLNLYHSRDHGKTWSHQDITPLAGRYEYGWLSLSKDDSTLGFGVYYRPDNESPWHVYGSVFKPGQKPALTSLDPKNPVQDAKCAEAPGDLLGSDFNTDGTLNVTWTRNTATTGQCGTLTMREIWIAHSLK